MIPPFEEALENLINEYANTDRDDIISALGLKLMALREEQEANADDDDE